MKKQFNYIESPYAFMTPEEIKKQKEREGYEKSAKDHAAFLNEVAETDENTTESVMQGEAFTGDCGKSLKKKLVEDANKQK